jgi:hypothetical protein
MLRRRDGTVVSESSGDEEEAARAAGRNTRHQQHAQSEHAGRVSSEAQAGCVRAPDAQP